MKTFSLSMLLAGTIVGAGFASGKEILSFFGSKTPIFVAPLIGIGIFLCCILFLSIGNKVKAPSLTEVNRAIMGKAHFAADIFLLFNSLTVLAGMLSAMDSIFSLIFPLAPLYSILSGIAAALLITHRIKFVLKGSIFIMPILIIAIILTAIFSISSPQIYGLRLNQIPAVIIYIGINMMLACTVFTAQNGLKRRQILVASAAAASIITLLMTLIIFALNSNTMAGDMPMLSLALSRSKLLFYIAFLGVVASIFSTILTAMNGLNGWLSGFLGHSPVTAATVLVAGLIVSNLGFDKIVSFLYPIIGILGIVYIAISLVFIIRSKEKNPSDGALKAFRQASRLDTSARLKGTKSPSKP